MNEALLEKIVALAKADDDIRTVILEGSLAARSQVDELSDYDVDIFTRDAEKYLGDDRWLSRIGEILLYQKERFPFYEDTVPTRLVLFRDRERVDFSFWRPGILADIVRGDKTYESYRNGYRVLVDKDSLAAHLPLPDGTGFSTPPPGRERFRQTLYDFWFEAYCVARALARRDLWYGKLIENRFLKDHLFQISVWHHQARHDWKRDPRIHVGGKRFGAWAPADLTAALAHGFTPFDLAGTWQGLFSMVELFDRLARETATRLGIDYPDRVEGEILDYLRYLEAWPGSRTGPSHPPPLADR